MTSFTDDFNRADSTDLGAGWVEVSGDWSIVSNRLSPGAAGGTIVLRAAGAMATSDNYAQVTIAVAATASQGVWCRGDSTLTSGYLLRNNGTNWTLFKVVSSTFTAIGTAYVAAAVSGDIAKVQAVGSTIKGFVNGIERISVTDIAVTSGTSVGIRSDSTSALRYDDFAAADVTVGATLSVAAEVDTAQALTGAKAATLGVAAEQDTAQTIAAAKTATLGIAGAVESAQPFTGAKTATLTTAIEQDAAQPVSGVVTAALGVAGVVETAVPLTGSKTAVLPPALEVDTARPLVAASVTVPSPERTYRVPAERRRLDVAAENRTLTVR